MFCITGTLWGKTTCRRQRSNKRSTHWHAFPIHASVPTVIRSPAQHNRWHSSPFRLLWKLENLNFPDNVSYHGELTGNKWYCKSPFSVSCLKNGTSLNFGWRCQATRASTTTSYKRLLKRIFTSGTTRRNVFVVHQLILTYRGQQSCLGRTLPVSERHWGGHVRPRFRWSSLSVSCWTGPISRSIVSHFWPCGLPPGGAWIIDRQELNFWSIGPVTS